jgi:hypothetical protein
VGPCGLYQVGSSSDELSNSMRQVLTPHLALSASTTTLDDSVFLHHQFGHAKMEKLHVMQKFQVVNELTSNPLHSIPLCKGCFFGKQQLMFPKEGNCATTILALVHFDVWRPMQTHSHGGARYFLLY